MKLSGTIFGLLAALSFSFAEVTPLHCGGCEKGGEEHSEEAEKSEECKDCKKCDGCDKEESEEPAEEKEA